MLGCFVRMARSCRSRQRSRKQRRRRGAWMGAVGICHPGSSTFMCMVAMGRILWTGRRGSACRLPGACTTWNNDDLPDDHDGLAGADSCDAGRGEDGTVRATCRKRCIDCGGPSLRTVLRGGQSWLPFSRGRRTPTATEYRAYFEKRLVRIATCAAELPGAV